MDGLKKNVYVQVIRPTFTNVLSFTLTYRVVFVQYL